MPEAVIGFIGVIIGALLAPLIDWVRAWKVNSKNARYLAIRVICVLDKFIDMCVVIAADNGDLDQHGYYQYRAPRPNLIPFSEDLDWRVIDHKLAYDILSLPNKIDSVEHYISNLLIDPPYDELGQELRYEYAEIGLFAININNRLRNKYDIPQEAKEARNSDWSPHKFLTETKEEIELARKKNEENQAKFLLSMSPKHWA